MMNTPNRLSSLVALVAAVVAIPTLALAESFYRFTGETTATRHGEPVQYVTVHPETLRPEGAERLTLPLRNGETVTIDRTKVEVRGPVSSSWHGQVAGARSSSIFSVHGTAVAGVIHTEDSVYELRPSAAGHMLIARELAKLPACGGGQVPDHDGHDHGNSLAGRESTPPTATDDGSVIQVLAVFTAEAREETGSQDNLTALAQLGIDLANDAYTNSNITTTLNLAATFGIGYAESGNGIIDLDRFRIDGDGFADIVHSLRDQFNADLVSIFVDFAAGICGVAYRQTGTIPFAEFGFNLQRVECIASDTLTHEIGHNQGCAHDRLTFAQQGSDPSLVVADYAYGYAINNDFHTVMAYTTACNFCPRERVFSDPSVIVNGSPAGIAAGDPNAAHNSRVVNETALDVANFRQGTPPAQTFTLPTLTEWGLIAMLGIVTFLLFRRKGEHLPRV